MPQHWCRYNQGDAANAAVPQLPPTVMTKSGQGPVTNFPSGPTISCSNSCRDAELHST